MVCIISPLGSAVRFAMMSRKGSISSIVRNSSDRCFRTLQWTSLGNELRLKSSRVAFGATACADAFAAAGIVASNPVAAGCGNSSSNETWDKSSGQNRCLKCNWLIPILMSAYLSGLTYDWFNSLLKFSTVVSLFL